MNRFRSLFVSVNYPRAIQVLQKISYSTQSKSEILKDHETEPRQNFDILIEDYIKKTTDLNDLENFKESLFNKVNKLNHRNFDANFMRVCYVMNNYSMGQSYLKHLDKQNKTANTATLSRFLCLAYACRANVTNIQELEDICATLKSRGQYLDSNTTDSIILGLTLTKKWKEALNLLEGYKKLNSSPKGSVVNAVINCSLDHGELETASNLMSSLIHDNKKLTDSVIDNWLQKSSNDEIVLQKFMQLLSQVEYFLKRQHVEKLKTIFESREENKLNGVFTKVNLSSGKCQNCGQQLDEIAVSQEEHTLLKTAFTERVLYGEDVFIGSSPEEIERFLNFINKTVPYDVVIDGLNVAYMAKHPSGTAKLNQVLAVVKHFSRSNQRVLLMGKKHMVKWSPTLMKDIGRHCAVYLTEDLSRDDPFFLHATLHSGRNTKFMSKDFLRDHLFRLRDLNLRSLFRRWQLSSQLKLIAVAPNGSVVIREPHKHSTSTQFSNGRWHIPYNDGELEFGQHLPESFLCLKP